MKNNGKVFLIICLFLGISTSVFAQQSFNASNGECHGSEGNSCYSIGQVFYHTHNNTEVGSEVQGVHQPFEISIITGNNEDLLPHISLSLYPNPTPGILKININTLEFKDIHFLLFNVNNQLMHSGQINGGQKIMDLSEFPSATYFLQIVNNDKVIKIFRVVKN